MAARRYDPAFRTQMAGLAIDSGQPLAQIAREHGIAESTLRSWVTKERRCRDGAPVPTWPYPKGMLSERLVWLTIQYEVIKAANDRMRAQQIRAMELTGQPGTDTGAELLEPVKFIVWDEMTTRQNPLRFNRLDDFDDADSSSDTVTDYDPMRA